MFIVKSGVVDISLYMSFGHNIYDGPPVNILAVGGDARLTKCFNHPLFGESYYDPNRRVNVACARRILTDSSKFRASADSSGAFEATALPTSTFDGARFRASWRRGVLTFQHSETSSLDEHTVE